MDRTQPELRKALLEKLGVTRQRLSQRVKQRKAELPMGTPEAVYTIAFEEGLDISRYLGSEETAAVRHLVSQLQTRAPGEGGVAGGSAGTEKGVIKRAAPPKRTLVTISGVGIERLPGMSAATAREAKTMSEKVYPTLYIFENSARELIATVLTAAIGPDWWDRVVPRRVRETAQRNKDGEADDPWHGRRGAKMIDYTLLSELPSIVKANDAWPHFEPIFGRQSFFEELVNDMNVSRRVVAHMNPVSAEDVKHIEVAFRKWAKTLKAKESLLP